MNAMDLIRRPDRMTLGIELPLDNDWSPAGEARRRAELEGEAAQSAAARLEAETEASLARAERASAEAEAAVATASHQEFASALEALQPPAASKAAESKKATSATGALKGWRALLASAVLASLAGLGAGIWLGKGPALAFPWSPSGTDEVRLRLDDRMADPALRGARAGLRNKTQR